MSTKPAAVKPPDVPTSEEFTRTMGQICWLMTLSPAHRDRPISLIEAHVSAPLMFKQVRVYLKDKQPLAAVTWAYASDEVKRKIAEGNHVMGLNDWRSGPEVVVVDCISPFAPSETFVNQFMAQVPLQNKSNPT